MTLLSMVQNVAANVGLPQPTSVIGNTDPNIVEVRSFVERAGQRLVWEHDWQVLTYEATVTTVATPSQGAVYPSGGVRVIDETMFNRSDKQPVLGPLTPMEWQEIQAYGDNAEESFRILNNNLYITPTPPAGQTIAYEYISEYWIYDQSEATILVGTMFTDDDADYALLDETLIEQGAIWRYRRKKGYEFDDEKAEYEDRLSWLKSNDKKQRIRNMARGGKYPQRVPLSSWDIT